MLLSDLSHLLATNQLMQWSLEVVLWFQKSYFLYISSLIKTMRTPQMEIFVYQRQLSSHPFKLPLCWDLFVNVSKLVHKLFSQLLICQTIHLP